MFGFATNQILSANIHKVFHGLVNKCLGFLNLDKLNCIELKKLRHKFIAAIFPLIQAEVSLPFDIESTNV